MASAAQLTTNARARDPAAVWYDVRLLKVWAGNPRKNKATVPEVVESLIELGWGRTLVARKADGELAIGHTARLAALQLPGLWASEQHSTEKRSRWHPDAIHTAETHEVPVRFVDLTQRKSRQLALADNRLGERSKWDEQLLDEALSSLDLAEAKLAGWDSDDLEQRATRALKKAERATKRERRRDDERDDEPEQDEPPEPDDLARDALAAGVGDVCPHCGGDLGEKV